MGAKDIKMDEIIAPVFKYRLNDLEEKIKENHSEVLTRLGILEGKMDTFIMTYQKKEIDNVKETTIMKKDIEKNDKNINNIWKGIATMAAVVFGGIIKFLFDLIKVK